MTNRLILLAACALFATTGMASASPRYNPSYGVAQPDKSGGVKVVAGVVTGSGSGYGSGFQVSHPETGEYVISIPSGTFKQCPVVNVTPAGTNGAPPLANLYGYNCTNSGVTLTILILGSTNGDAEDNAFHFTAIQP